MLLLPQGLFEFQEKASNFLLETTLRVDSKQNVVLKAPTGAGKTILLLDYIDKYLHANKNAAFVWLCPGKGNLEEQSMKKMQKYLPLRVVNSLFDSLLHGFSAQSTTFINWELVTKKGNTAISDTEKKNLFDRIAEAHRNDIHFVIIIDEEHSNDTKKAQAIINSFAAKNIVRVSATTKANKLCEFYEIPEIDVITSGLITKAIYINEDVDPNKHIDDHNYLIDLALKKREQIASAYREDDRKIRPLIIVQFPNSSSDLIKDVEKHLESLGYTYENKLLAKWMDTSKENIESIEEHDADPVVLLIKQAIATGWDCPRAKILVKLRENMDEAFSIQTIGRIRRMPEQRHYDNELLDHCYLFTFDKEYTIGLKESLRDAFDVKRTFLKNKCKTFELKKQLRDQNYIEVDERIVLNKIADYLIKTYDLTNNYQENETKLIAAGYRFDEGILMTIVKGKFVVTSSLLESDNTRRISTLVDIDLHRHTIDLSNSIEDIGKSISFPKQKSKVVLERLFRSNSKYAKKILSLSIENYYSFIINNRKQLKDDFRKVAALAHKQMKLNLTPTIVPFKLPEQELYRHDSFDEDIVEMLTNAYEEYPSSTLVPGLRSTPERLFERYCENNDSVEWVYRNGDTGQQYFSIIYTTGINKQMLFYPDYIVKLKNGDVWIIETKGGEDWAGNDRNIDKYAEIKFEALRDYTTEHNLKFGFVREKPFKDQLTLFLNNTEYSDGMNEYWKPLSDFF